jgi:ABC-type sugar transport system substrate-binding protein
VHIGLFLVQSGSLFQAKLKEAAEIAARRAGATLEVLFAEGSSRTQHEQLFSFIRREDKADGFLVQPVEGAGIRFAIREARQKGIACAFINQHPAFLEELRADGGLVFSVTPDNDDIGRIQGEQFRALLSKGGTVLYVTGPPTTNSVVQRLNAMETSKGPLISTIQVAANWTEQGGEQAVTEWLKTTCGFVPFDMVGAQNDDMGAGAHTALLTMADALDQPKLKTTPITGVDGLPEFGRRLVEEKKLAATVIMPPTTGKAIEALVAALRDGPTPELEIRMPVESYPPLDVLRGGATSSTKA